MIASKPRSLLKVVSTLHTLEENKPASYEHWFRFKNTQQRQPQISQVLNTTSIHFIRLNHGTKENPETEFEIQQIIIS